MPGMGGALQLQNPTIVLAFRAALRRDLLIVLVLAALVALSWNVLRASQLRLATRAANGGGGPTAPALAPEWSAPEAPARRVLRIAFGLLWLLDGILQIQSAIPVGLASQVMTPAASTSPGWVRSLVATGTTIWNNHPVTAATASVWVQVGIGLWLIVAARGRWSRLAGLAAAGWGVTVWIFGEAFGAIFAPGLTVLFGAPGAVLIYAIAGLLVALPERVWYRAALGRAMLFALGAFFTGMAVLQAWPGRGFWQGHIGRNPGTLAAMVHSMSTTSQPRFLSSWVASFARFDEAHGFAVNLVAVIVLAAIGLGLASLRVRFVRAAVVLAVVFCLADWVLVEDFGFFGGLGTDPNSMLPLLATVAASALAAFRVPEPLAAPVPIVARSEQGWLQGLAARPAHTFRSIGALGALAVTLIGVAPMTVAAAAPNADAIVSQAIDGTPDVTNSSSAPFSLTDQNGHTVSLASLRGKTVALTFLDPVCTNDCPVIAQEFKAADRMLGSRASGTVFIAVDTNPLYRARAVLLAFDHEEGLAALSNWRYLTGSTAQLNRVWAAYGVQVQVSPGGSMIAHNDIAFVIGPNGKTRDVLNADPGPGSQSSKSSFAGVLAGAMSQVLAHS
ncbi:MAG: hypothetical protein JWM85_1298 [Acidimicrobiaceae bacterium]|nr:hypothetical protein [Acidimicrobiaceae bacterium]